MNYNFLMQFPTIFRPTEFKECLEIYLNTCSKSNFLHFNIVCDKDDDSMNNDEMKEYIENLFFDKSYCSYSLHYDENTTKIGAINAHINEIIEDYDILYCLSDDMIPQVNDWDKTLADSMKTNFPNLDGCVHVNTGEREDWRNYLITLSILGKNLYKEFGYIYHPDYKSFFCDNEFTDIMKNKGRICYIDEIIVRHEHHEHSHNANVNRNAGKVDSSVSRNYKNWNHDSAVYNTRKAKGFPR